MDNSNEFFICKLVSSHLLITGVELKPCLLCIFKKIRSICKLSNKKYKLDEEIEFEVEDGLELSINDAIRGYVNWIEFCTDFLY